MLLLNQWFTNSFNLYHETYSLSGDTVLWHSWEEIRTLHFCKYILNTCTNQSFLYLAQCPLEQDPNSWQVWRLWALTGRGGVPEQWPPPSPTCFRSPRGRQDLWQTLSPTLEVAHSEEGSSGWGASCLLLILTVKLPFSQSNKWCLEYLFHKNCGILPLKVLRYRNPRESYWNI